MPLSERTRNLLLSALGAPDAVANLIADIENIVTSEIEDGAVTTPKLADLAVTSGKIDALAVTNAKVAAGIDAAKIADGTVSNAEFQFIGTLSSNAQTQLDAKLPTASFTDAAVTGKLITGYVSGAGTVAASDSLLQAIQKLNGNIAAIPASPVSVLSTNITPVSVSTTTGTLMTYTVPGGTLANNGDSLEINGHGTYTLNASAALTGTLGGQTIMGNFANFDPDGASYILRLKFTRLSATSLLVNSQRFCSKPNGQMQPDHTGCYNTTVTVTLANPLLLSFNVTGNSDGTIDQKMLQVCKLAV